MTHTNSQPAIDIWHHPDHPCTTVMCHRAAPAEHGNCPWHLTYWRLIHAGVLPVQAAMAADNIMGPSILTETQLAFWWAKCRDCLSKLHIVLTDDRSLIVQVAHSPGCPDWDSEEYEIAAVIPANGKAEVHNR